MRKAQRFVNRWMEYSAPVRKAQLPFASIDHGAGIPSVDEDGNVTSYLGGLFDGGSGVLVVSDPIPPVPTRPTFTTGLGTITIMWDGIFLEEEPEDLGNPQPDPTVVAPTYWSRTEVHVSQDPQFTAEFAETLEQPFETPRGGKITIAKPPGTYYIRFVSRSKSGRRSDPSPVAEAILLAPIEHADFADALNQLQAEAQSASNAADAANTAAATAQAEATQAEADAQAAVAAAAQAALDAEAAEGSATASAADVATAQQAASDALADAQAALARAEAAEASASTAEGAALTAQNEADASAQAAADALAQAIAAGDNATAAQTAATTAQGHADDAAASASAAGTAAAQADADAAQAAADAAQALADAAAAAQSATNAENSASTAAGSATAAETRADDAAADAAAALQNAIDAGTNATAAQNAADAAQAAATTAAQEADAAGTSAAQADAAAAQAAADAAQAVADAAQAMADAATAISTANQAAQDAGLAVDSASKNVRIFRTLTEPAWSGPAESAMWYKRNGSTAPVTEWYVWDGDSFEQQEFDEAFLPQVNIGTGTYGDLTGDRIGANEIEARHIRIGDFTNLATLSETGDVEIEWGNGGTDIVGGWNVKNAAANPYLMFKEKDGPVPWSTTMGGTMYFEFTVTSDVVGTVNFSIWGYDQSGANVGSVSTSIDVDLTEKRVTGTLPTPATSSTPYQYLIGLAGVESHPGIKVKDVTVRMMLSGTSADGTTLIGPNGIQTFFPDGSIATQLGNFGEKMLGIGEAQIGPSGGASFPTLSVTEDPQVAGKPLLNELVTYEPDSPYPIIGQIDWLPRGTITRGQRDWSSHNIWNGEEHAIMELSFPKVAGRTYQFVVQPFGIYMHEYCYLVCRFATGTTRPTLTSPIWARIPFNVTQALGAVSGDTKQMMLPVGGTIDMPATVTEQCNLLFSIHNPYDASNYRATVFASADGGTVNIAVNDVGMNITATGIDRSDTRNENTGENNEPPPPPQEDNFTITRSASATRSYNSAGNHYTFDESKLFQGQSPAAGDTRAMVMFPDLTGDLSGATISSVEVYLYYEHWWYASGGTANVGLHGYSGLQGQLGDGGVNNRVGSFHFDRGQGKWLNVPSAYWNEIKTGVYKGITIQGNGLSDYGYASAFGSRQPKIRIKGKK